MQRAQSTYEQVPIYDLQIVNQEGKDIVKGKVCISIYESNFKKLHLPFFFK